MANIANLFFPSFGSLSTCYLYIYKWLWNTVISCNSTHYMLITRSLNLRFVSIEKFFSQNTLFHRQQTKVLIFNNCVRVCVCVCVCARAYAFFCANVRIMNYHLLLVLYLINTVNFKMFSSINKYNQLIL